MHELEESIQHKSDDLEYGHYIVSLREVSSSGGRRLSVSMLSSVFPPLRDIPGCLYTVGNEPSTSCCSSSRLLTAIHS